MPPRRLPARKLLVASLGVAALSYVGCDTISPRTGNLMPPQHYPNDVPPPAPSSASPTEGGQAAPPPPRTAAPRQVPQGTAQPAESPPKQ